MINRIIKGIPAIFLMAFLSGCAATGPVGTWDYHITDTPEGDFSGNMVIEKNEGNYSGHLFSNGRKINLNNVTLNEDQLSGKFNYQGTSLQLIGEFSKDSFSGKVKAGYESYPMTAEKVKK